MTLIGCTGHQEIPDGARHAVRAGIRRVLDDAEVPIVGLSSLAVGADQMFAELVLQAGGTLRVIVPSQHYETTFDEAGRGRYHALLAAAADVERLDHPQPTEAAFLAAGQRIVEMCDVLTAVWDGRASRGLGGTADIVDYARRQGRRFEIVWPAGTERQ